MGRKRGQIVAQLAGEHAAISLLGGAAALPIAGGSRGILLLAAFLGIQTATSLAAAIRLCLENPMKIFLRME